ncbi:MAG: sugar phosphate isomerase/epimerase [Actinomycetota bacterium]|nr:sugar phosphate isomerase/epimerase [Actinomycetota bacterium]
MTIPVAFSTGSLHPFGLERVYSWAAEVGCDGIEIMMDDRWDTHQSGYLDRLAERHGVPIRAFHPPLHRGVWNLGPQETLVRVAKLARSMEVPVVVAHPPPPGRSLKRWSAGPLQEAREQGVSVAVENMPQSEVRGIFGLRRSRSCHLPEHLLGLGDVTLDTSHVGASKVDLMRAYSVLAGQIRHVHLSDSNLTGGDQHRLPGKGRLPLRPFLAALAESDYPGVVSLELKPWPLGAPEPETILERMRGALEFARRALGGDRRALRDEPDGKLS